MGEDTFYVVSFERPLGDTGRTVTEYLYESEPSPSKPHTIFATQNPASYGGTIFLPRGALVRILKNARNDVRFKKSALRVQRASIEKSSLEQSEIDALIKAELLLTLDVEELRVLRVAHP